MFDVSNKLFTTIHTIAQKSRQEFEIELQLVERECCGEIKHIVS